MALRSAIRESMRRRRERLASKRMALRLALFLGLVIAAVAIYWQVQVRQALQAARAPEMLEACGDLEETDELVQTDSGVAEGVNEAALKERLERCEAEGY